MNVKVSVTIAGNGAIMSKPVIMQDIDLVILAVRNAVIEEQFGKH